MNCPFPQKTLKSRRIVRRRDYHIHFNGFINIAWRKLRRQSALKPSAVGCAAQQDHPRTHFTPFIILLFDIGSQMIRKPMSLIVYGNLINAMCVSKVIETISQNLFTSFIMHHMKLSIPLAAFIFPYHAEPSIHHVPCNSEYKNDSKRRQKARQDCFNCWWLKHSQLPHIRNGITSAAICPVPFKTVSPNPAFLPAGFT